jgi:hypothetical protein
MEKEIDVMMIFNLVLGAFNKIQESLTDPETPNKITVDEGLGFVESESEILGIANLKLAKVNKETIEKAKQVLDYVYLKLGDGEYTFIELVQCIREGMKQFGLSDNVIVDLSTK